MRWPYFLQSNPPYGGLSVYYVWVHLPGVLPKTNKDIVYTPMSGSPIISVVVYARFWGSPRLKV